MTNTSNRQSVRRSFHVDVVSAHAEIFSGEATMLFACAEMGEVGIAPRHAPLLTRLRPGDLRIQFADGEELLIYVSGGMLEVQPHVVTVLADTVLRAEQIDEVAAQRVRQQAEKKIAGQLSQFDYAKAKAELAEAIAQLRTVEELRKRKKTHDQ